MGQNQSILVRMPKYGHMFVLLMTQLFFVHSGYKFIYEFLRPLVTSKVPMLGDLA